MSLESTKEILVQSLEMEKQAEINCAQIMSQLQINGFAAEIEKIKNDEIKHQELVQKLLELLNY